MPRALKTFEVSFSPEFGKFWFLVLYFCHCCSCCCCFFLKHSILKSTRVSAVCPEMERPSCWTYGGATDDKCVHPCCLPMNLLLTQSNAVSVNTGIQTANYDERIRSSDASLTWALLIRVCQMVGEDNHRRHILLSRRVNGTQSRDRAWGEKSLLSSNVGSFIFWVRASLPTFPTFLPSFLINFWSFCLSHYLSPCLYFCEETKYGFLWTICLYLRPFREGLWRIMWYASLVVHNLSSYYQKLII